jgi:ATP-dependent RNA circularization protein (DNA/RNA ligase family)
MDCKKTVERSFKGDQSAVEDKINGFDAYRTYSFLQA